MKIHGTQPNQDEEALLESVQNTFRKISPKSNGMTIETVSVNINVSHVVVLGP